MDVEVYEARLRKRVGEAEYERHKELVRLLARNLALEDVLWEEILLSIRVIRFNWKPIIYFSSMYIRVIGIYRTLVLNRRLR